MRCIYYNNELALETEFPNYYATATGKIVTTKIKGGNGKTDEANPREHCYKVDKDGYLEVCLSQIVDGTQKRFYRRVHRLVWETFNGKIQDNLTIDHIDKNTQNNNLSNLRLLSREDNTRVARKGVKCPKRFLYKLYLHNSFVGIYDRDELKELIGLGLHDYYKTTPNLLKIKSKGYSWIKMNVEDIEKVSQS
jgi:hypothetical protein